MSRKCKCKICKKELTTDNAYLVVDEKDKRNYYCTKEEYDEYIKEINNKNKCEKYITDILNVPFLTPMFKKELNKLRKYYSYQIIQRTFKDNLSNIRWFLDNKAGDNDYANMRYIVSIILNNIQKSAKNYNKEQENMKLLFENSNDVKTLDIIDDMYNVNKTNNNKKDIHDISMFLDD